MTDNTTYPWHEQPWRQLSNARQAGRMPHAVLLAGPQGLGKSAFARRLSDALVCTTGEPDGGACGSCTACRLSAAGSHPDQIFVHPEEPGKMIKIDAIRDLVGKSVLAAQEGGYRVFLINPADAMNRAAANALLKTLEEPASRSVMVLVSSHPHRLPATIRSRCQMVKFAPPPAGTVRAWLAERHAGSDIDGLLAVSGGAPLRAEQALEQGWLDEDRQIAVQLAALKQRQTNPLQVVEEWEKRPITLLVDGLKRCISDLVKLASGLGAAVIYHPGLQAELQTLGQGIDLKKLYEFNDDLLRAERESANNLNVQMMLEHLANRWLQITRHGGR